MFLTSINFGFGPHWPPLQDLDDNDLDDVKLSIFDAIAGFLNNDNDNDNDFGSDNELDDEQLSIIDAFSWFPPKRKFQSSGG